MSKYNVSKPFLTLFIRVITIYALFASENFLRENIYEKVKGKKNKFYPIILTSMSISDLSRSPEGR